MMGWQTKVLTIPVAQPCQSSAINHLLLTQYGFILMQNIRALTYVANTRDAEHSMMCYNCIMMSLYES